MAHVLRILEAGCCPYGAVVAGPRPGKIPPSTLAAPWRHAAETLPIALRFRCETDSSVPLFREHCLHAFPPPRKYQFPFFSSPHPSTISRHVRLPSALPPVSPLRSPVLPSTPPDLCAFRPTSFPSARHGPLRPSLHLVHSNMTRCSLFAFPSPKQYSQFLNTLRELGISLIRLGINSSKQF